MLNRRGFLKAGAAVGSALTVYPAARQPARGDWFRKSPRVFLLDFQFPDPLDQSVPGMPHFLQKFDTEGILDQVTAARANVIVVHAKCSQGNAYYNTQVAHKHSDLGARDLMKEFSTLCRARSLTVLFYVALSWERRSFLSHPERQERNAQGQGVIYANKHPLRAAGEERYLVCMNGPHRQYTKDILAELSRGYDFDGFWLDQFSWLVRFNPCYCSACEASYRRDTGRRLPRGSLASEEGRHYIRWRRALNTEILHELVDNVHSINPMLTVTHNGSGLYAGSDWDFCDSEDYTSHEFRHHEGQANLSLMCRKNWALKPETPFEIETWRFAMGPPGTAREYQVRPTPALLTEMAAVVAHSGFPQYYDQVRHDGTLVPRSLEALKPAFQQVEARQPWSGRGHPVPFAAILWSKATDVYAPVGKHPSQNARALHAEGIEGIHHGLIESHIPVGVLTERDAARRQWRGARVILAPDVECLPSSCVAALETYVSEGGGLVVTGRTSLRNEDGTLRDNFALAHLLGMDFVGMTKYLYTYLILDQRHPVTEHLPMGFPMSVFETLQVKGRTHKGVSTLGTIVDPMPGAYWGFPPDIRTTGVPALTVRDYGKGRVVYAGASLGSIYKRFSHADTRQLIVDAVMWAAKGEPPVSAVAPETVEVIPWRDEQRKQTIVHLVNRTGAGPAQGSGLVVHEAIPVHDITVEIAKELAGAKATAQPSGRRLPAKWVGDRMQVQVERLDIWETLVIE